MASGMGKRATFTLSLNMGTPASRWFQRFSKHRQGRRLMVPLFLHFSNFYGIIIFEVVLKICNEGHFYDES